MVAELDTERGYLMNLTFRMLGSWHDAEDIVQQTYERWYRLDPSERAAIERPRAWLTTAASRLCLNLLDSARVRRERYVGPWLPEPLPDGTTASDPLDRIILDDSVNMALLVVLESLTPAERVAFVLHEVFGVPFAEIAEMVGRTPEATRQLASSARRHIRELRTVPADAAEHARLTAAFQEACAAGDLRALVAVLDHAVVAVTDGGGKAKATPRPIVGADNVARFLLGLITRAGPGIVFESRTVSGQPGFVGVRDGRVVSVVALGTSPGRIRGIWIVVNPDKLSQWNG